MEFIPALDSYAYHLHADAWEPIAVDAWGLEDLINKAAELQLKGFQSADMLHFAPYMNTEGEIPANQIHKIRGQLQKLGLQFELGTGGTDPFRLKKELSIAAQLDARVVRTFLGGGIWEEERRARQLLRQAKDEIEQLIPLLKQYDNYLAVENHQDISTDMILHLLKEIDSPRLGVCLDTGNQLGVMEDTLEAARILAPYVLSVHIKDYHVLPHPEGGYRLIGAIPGTGRAGIQEQLELISSRRKDHPLGGIQLNLESAVEEIIIGPEHPGWIPRYAAKAGRILEILGKGPLTPAAMEIEERMKAITQTELLSKGREFEEEFTARGAQALLSFVKGK